MISISQWDKYDIADEKITFSVREILSNKETYEGSISTLNLDKNSGSVKIFTPYSVLGGSGANSEKYMEDFQALVSQGDINSPVSGSCSYGDWDNVGEKTSYSNQIIEFCA